ncbi:MAG: hypothetical protein KatS3mg057_0605 [Herpetosiphonaceae bacterium]|nr:MAG: hypothetical protein KatS3mg057_0605 [Herpetosiphonaceae bacterium]
MRTTIALTGDVMLGRLVDRYVIRNPTVEPPTLWGDVLPLLLAADIRMINLECMISLRGERWRPQSKAFHFRAHPRAIEFLKAARIDCVTLANNHVLDYGADALIECLDLLDQAGIKHTGAGRDPAEALQPAYLSTPAGTVAVVALTDNEPEWEVAPGVPGINVVDYDEHGLIEPYASRMTELIAIARRQASFVVVSAHVGPNWGRPSRPMQRLAHQLIDQGADLYWGHSNHTPQGIEVYRGKPILYSTGDFVDDYAIDPAERNDLSFLFEVELHDKRIHIIRLHPTTIEQFYVRRATEPEARWLLERMRALSAAFESRVIIQDREGSISCYQ